MLTRNTDSDTPTDIATLTITRAGACFTNTKVTMLKFWENDKVVAYWTTAEGHLWLATGYVWPTTTVHRFDSRESRDGWVEVSASRSEGANSDDLDNLGRWLDDDDHQYAVVLL